MDFNTLRWAVEIDDSKADKKLSKLLSQLDKANNTSFHGIIKNMSDLDKEIERTANKLAKLQQAQLDAEKIDRTTTKAYQNRKRDIDKLSESLAKLQEIQKKVNTSQQAQFSKRIAEAATKDPIIKDTQYAPSILKNKDEVYQRAGAGPLVKDVTALKSTAEGLKLVTAETQKLRIAQEELSQRTQSAEAFLKNFELSLDPAAEKTAKLEEELRKAEERLKDAFIKGDNQGVEQAKKQIISLNKQLEKQQKQTKKSASYWQVLLGRIKNISIYRAIRTGIKWVTSGFQDGLNNLTQYSDSVNSTMSNLNGSLNQIKNTMGIAFASVLQALEPVLTTLADTIVDIVNSFNLAMAKMSGKNVYTKAKKNVDDYAASLQKAQKFSFDTFEVLSGGGETQPYEMFEEGKVDEDANKLSETFGKILQIIKDIGKAVGEIIQEAINSGSLDAILDIVSFIAKVIGGIVRTILNIISGLQKIGALRPLLIGIASAFIAIKVAAMAAAVAKAAAWIMANPIAGAVAVTAGIAALAAAIAGISSLTSSVEGFTNGGFTTANFIATNENGRREWVGRNAGATAVVNDTQMSDIMYQAVRKGSEEGMINAIYETGLLDAGSQRLVIDSRNINDGAFARAIFPALKVESTRRGGNQL